jgi:hypothetical protein
MDDILPTSPLVPKYDPTQDAIFVATFVETGDPIIAATRANIQDPSTSIIVTAQRYINRPEIRAAIEVVQSLERDAPVKVTRDSIVESCQSIFEKALTDRQYASATGALKLQAALLGLLEQKITVSHSYKVEEMSNDELLRIINGPPPETIETTYSEVPG